MTNHVCYIHGVNVRDPAYAEQLDQELKKTFSGPLVTAAVYWGDVSDAAEQRLLQEWKKSDVWDHMWFPEFRASMMLQLIGDGALYVSPSFGSSIVRRITQTLHDAFSERQPGDVIHLVTHSWGAVIVLDVLFADRWLEKNVPGHDDVQALRDSLFGMGTKKKDGLRLASITTMGSPMSLFSLMDGDFADHPGDAHSISDAMRNYCSTLYKETGTPLNWFNFVHPGDAFAYPNSGLLKTLLRDDAHTVNATDALVDLGAVAKLAGATLGKTDAAVVGAASAHNGYWNTPSVIDAVVKSITQTAMNSQIVT
jgi:hypothetical protein